MHAVGRRRRRDAAARGNRPRLHAAPPGPLCAGRAATRPPAIDALLRSAARDAGGSNASGRHTPRRSPKRFGRLWPSSPVIADTAALLRQAADELDALGWGCFGAGARRQYGELIGGEEGRRIVKDVDEQLMQRRA